MGQPGQGQGLGIMGSTLMVDLGSTLSLGKSAHRPTLPNSQDPFHHSPPSPSPCVGLPMLSLSGSIQSAGKMVHICSLASLPPKVAQMHFIACLRLYFDEKNKSFQFVLSCPSHLLEAFPKVSSLKTNMDGPYA